MRAKLIASAVLAMSLLVAPAAHAHGHGRDSSAVKPPAGSNERLRSALSGVPGIEVIVSDVVIPPNATVPQHTHPGEEFVYVIEGSAIHVEEGKPDRLYTAGESFVIPPQTAHAPRGGPKGARAIVFRVHKAGEPERTLVPAPTGAAKP